MSRSPFPYFTLGTIVKGFGRGSKELGIPTANFAEDVVEILPKEIYQGVYFGWAQLNNDKTVYRMVMSVGTNPFYNIEKRAMEAHILHKFPNDFYGETLKVVILGEIRKMTSFNSVDELKTAIENDIECTKTELDKEEYKRYKTDKYFTL